MALFTCSAATVPANPDAGDFAFSTTPGPLQACPQMRCHFITPHGESAGFGEIVLLSVCMFIELKCPQAPRDGLNNDPGESALLASCIAAFLRALQAACCRLLKGGTLGNSLKLSGLQSTC